MDNVKVFDTLDRKIEKLLGRLKQLETDNEKLRTDLAAARKVGEGGRRLQGVVERLEREQETCASGWRSSSTRSRRPTKRSRNAAEG